MSVDFIYQFARNRKNQPVGILYAEKIDGKVAFGWSKAHTTCKVPIIGMTIDKFDKERGLKIATARARVAIKEGNSAMYLYSVPRSMRIDMIHFITRCKKYFKDGQIDLGALCPFYETGLLRLSTGSLK